MHFQAVACDFVQYAKITGDVLVRASDTESKRSRNESESDHTIIVETPPPKCIYSVYIGTN